MISENVCMPIGYFMVEVWGFDKSKISMTMSNRNKDLLQTLPPFTFNV